LSLQKKLKAKNLTSGAFKRCLATELEMQPPYHQENTLSIFRGSAVFV